jgi:hypothetical protein
MNYVVGFRKEDGSIGRANLSDFDGDYLAAAEFVKKETGSKVALILVKG